MKKTINNDKYWENEEGELIEFGNSFMRCYDKAGKLQIGIIFLDLRNGEKKYLVKFVIDRKDLINSKEGLSFLQQTLEDWEEANEN